MSKSDPDVHLLSQAQLDEIDRNARAYGWEIGRGHPLTDRIESTSEDNPFLRADWRDRIVLCVRRCTPEQPADDCPVHSKGESHA